MCATKFLVEALPPHLPSAVLFPLHRELDRCPSSSLGETDILGLPTDIQIMETTNINSKISD